MCKDILSLECVVAQCNGKARAGPFHSLLFEICQEDNLTQRQASALGRQRRGRVPRLVNHGRTHPI